MNDANDTIAAIATAPGEAGIAVIRISGSKSLSVADAVLKVAPKVQGNSPSDRPAGTFLHGYVVNPSDQRSEHADEAICLIFARLGVTRARMSLNSNATADAMRRNVHSDPCSAPVRD